MRKDWDTLALCDRFFDAIEQKDFATLESCYAPEAVVWHSHDCLYQSRESNLEDAARRHDATSRRCASRTGASTPSRAASCSSTRSSSRTRTTSSARWTFASSRYTRDGMISRAYEYFDTGQIEKFLPPRGAA